MWKPTCPVIRAEPEEGTLSLSDIGSEPERALYFIDSCSALKSADDFVGEMLIS